MRVAMTMPWLFENVLGVSDILSSFNALDGYPTNQLLGGLGGWFTFWILVVGPV